MDCPAILVALAVCSATPQTPASVLGLVEEQAAPSACMTKEQARATFKTSHLYWHGSRHCWDNNRGAVRLRTPTNSRNPKRQSDEVALVADANGTPVQKREARIEIFYPALVREQHEVANDLYLMQRPITDWPLMLDIDVTGPDPDKGIDGCCWPPMETLR